ncbi:MAG: DegT/DnrJ/EryC1/StrS aminotransferase family protein [Candidatus Zambryskibacteria bacterium]|nr:DegT/DnrJ/EryC1/StrS aminotransferase family protein [Candidatus Zambryskibacteria bacterium]
MLNLVKSAFYKEKETRRALARFIERGGQLSYGKECRDFESAFAKWQGAKYAVMFSSGSTANFALVQALMHLHHLKRGDAVGFSAVTWPTNILPLIQLGLKPVPIDVDLKTLNISPKTLQTSFKKHKLKAVFLTHVLGLCDDIKGIVSFCKKNKIFLIEDTCEALGTVCDGKKLGSFGLGGTFSFFIGHHMSTIEGGMVVTNDEHVSRELRIIRSHGWDRHLEPHEQKSLRERHGVDDFYAQYTFYNLGNNFRPTEVSGFLGKIQLKHADTIVNKRERNFKKLSKAIHSKSDLYYPIETRHIEVISNFAFPLITRTKAVQEELVRRARGKVEIRPLIAGNITRQPFYKLHGSMHSEKLPNAEIIHERGLYFGNNPDLSHKDIQTLIEIFTNFKI